MAVLLRILLLCSLLPPVPLLASSAAMPVGVNYGTVADNLPPPAQVASLLQSTIIGRVKLFSPDATILRALASTETLVMVGIGNDQIKPLSSDVNSARQWVSTNLAPFLPSTKVASVCIGNEVLSTSDGEMIWELQYAMRNLHTALQEAGFQGVKVTTAHSMGLLQSSVPPSNGTFGAGPAAILTPILSFLSETGAPFLANAYPFFGYLANPNATQLQYALFNSSTPRYDPVTKLNYYNMFDAQIDAVYAAMAKLGFRNVTVAVGETGWPSAGDMYEPGVSLENAKAFNSNLVKHLTSGKGTPLKPNTIVETYIFALFNEDLKPGATSEKNYGLFRPDMTPVYDCGIMKNQPQNLPPSGGPVTKQWCVGKPNASNEALQEALDWACSQKCTDCSPLQPNRQCYNPNTLKDHASFAMNSYYQCQGRHPWNCDFGGAAVVVDTNPSHGSCVYGY